MQPEKPKDPFAGIVPRGAPCGYEAEEWRECLKQDDYMPDRDLKKCDKKRRAFYDCTKAWRASQPAVNTNQQDSSSSSGFFGGWIGGGGNNKNNSVTKENSQTPVGGLPELCSGLADKLRVCMEMSMFETAKCQREMTWLRECVGRVDPEVRGIVNEMDEEAKRLRKGEDDVLQIPQLTHMEQKAWHDLWNTKPKHGQDKV